MNDHGLAAQLEAVRHPPPPGDGAPRVLIVEPDSQLRHALLSLLRVEGMTVTEAAEGGSAIRMVREWHPTVVVTELRLGSDGQNGVTVAETIRELDPRLPVIIHSASFAPDAMPTDGRYGVFRFVTKGSGARGELRTAIRDAHDAYHHVSA